MAAVADWLREHLVSLGVATAYVLALLSAARAVLHTRTAQGAMAWVLALLLMPFLTLPFYWVFGRTKFEGYVGRRQRVMARAAQRLAEFESVDDFLDVPDERFTELHTLARRLGAGGFARGNRTKLLVDGEATFEEMLTAIAQARHFVLVQFYIFRDDGIGQRFQAALMERARAGVTVCFLYDEIGHRLGRRFLDPLRECGIACHPFDPGRKGRRLQINFRNHRKVLIVDGTCAFLGGLNVGDDYLGEYPSRGFWRDTHLRIDGPAAAQAQVSFFKDWFWATDSLPPVKFHIREEDAGEARVLVWHTGPSDPQPECLLGWLSVINNARQRVWLATPYFVPPEPVLHALRLAMLRGVEVRLLVPAVNDNRAVHLASQVHLADMANCGAQVYRWTDGFMHQKVALVDDGLVMIGTTNLDCRSIFINFEITALCVDAQLCAEVEQMLEQDFVRSERISLDEFRNAGYWHRLACRTANLFAPML
jgi:cardiolipin synthase